MKKLLVCFLSALFVLSLIACDSKTEVHKPQTPADKADVSSPMDTNSKAETEINSEIAVSQPEGETTPLQKEEPQKSVATTQTEFIDFHYSYTKFMTFMDNKIYYNGTDGTYCVDEKGGTPKKVTNFYGIEYTSLNDKVYFRVNPDCMVDNITDYEMRYFWYDVKTNEFERIPYNGSSYKIYNNKLIFYSQNQVYTSNLDGSDAKPITKARNTGDFIIYNNKIYYTSGYSELFYNSQLEPITLYFYTLHVTDLEGETDTVLFEIPSYQFIIANDKVISFKDEKIHIMDLNGNKISEFETGLLNISQLNYFNNKFYVLSGTSLYAFDFNGENKKLIDENVQYFAINDDKLYCYNNSQICRYNSDGTAKQQIT